MDSQKLAIIHLFEPQSLLEHRFGAERFEVILSTLEEYRFNDTSIELLYLDKAKNLRQLAISPYSFRLSVEELKTVFSKPEFK